MTLSSTLPAANTLTAGLSGLLSQLTVLTEILLHLLGRGVLAHSSNKDLPRLGLFALGFWCGRLRVDLLAVKEVRGDGEDFLQGGRSTEGDEAEASAPLKYSSLYFRLHCDCEH